MVFNARDIGVDSGTIVIADKENYELNGCFTKSFDELGKVFDVPNGEYIICWYMPDTWNGEVEGNNIIEITTGKMMVVDPCYIIPDNEWGNFIEKTNYLKDPPKGWIILDKHGGDGNFLVEIKLEKVIK